MIPMPQRSTRRAPFPGPPGLILPLAVALMLALPSGEAGAAQPESASVDKARFDFAIAPAPLDDAINAFIAATDWQVGFPAEMTRGLRSPGVNGRLTPAQALEKLLNGTGLGYRLTGPGMATLKDGDAKDNPGPAAYSAPLPKTSPGAITLGKVTVTARPEENDEANISLTAPTMAQSKARLEQVPGGTTLIDGERVREGAVFTAADTFAYAPGVYVGDSSGSIAGGSRISIRGSDINTSFSPIRGIKILRDGLPFTHANGFTDTEYLYWPIKQVEVYRGANAMEFGSSNLGGAINFITPTGYSADRLKVGTTIANNGYVNSSVSGGGVLGKGWDAFGSFNYTTFNGMRQKNDQELFYGYGNVGYRWDERNETRLHVDIQDIDYRAYAGGMTKQLLRTDPHFNDTTSVPKNGWPLYKFDLRHTMLLDGGDRFDFGAYYFNADFAFSDALYGFYRDLWQDAGFTWRHQINGELFGLKNRVVWGGLTQWMWINDHENDAVNGRKGPYRFNERDDWNNVEAYLEDQLDLSEDFRLVLGAQVNYRKASFQHRYPPVTAGEPDQGSQDFFNFNPKVGFTWQATRALQVFGNLSRSSEPPPLSNMADVYQNPQLTTQTGTTFEIGTRGQVDWLKWDLAFYQTWLNNELLIVPNPLNPTQYSTSNAGNTHHTGIELGLESNLPLGWMASDDALRLRGSYTWSHFQFDDDPVLKDNRLPGIPEHSARFEALYEHPWGIYAGPNLQVASSNWVDFANTLSADPYALLGARVGWKDNKHWHVFIDGRNLTNERYAASVWVMGNAQGQDGPQFNPGATRMVFAGFEYCY